MSTIEVFRSDGIDGYPVFQDNHSMDNQNSDLHLSNIVLKFTTLSETLSEIPSFLIDESGAKIGRDSSNEVSVPTDTKLAAEGHTIIKYRKGAFFIADGGFDFAASIRIGVGGRREQWIMETDSQFSAGNSVFRCCGEDDDGHLIVEVIEGPLKGSKEIIPREGATIGRSSDNSISVPDRELSRKHSKVFYDNSINKYVVVDIGSTNGTYMQLVGPYRGLHKLHLNDHILVGRTGFSVNRFDYGLSEEIGYRQTMEDSCAVVQHLNVGSLNIQELWPQSYFAVYDGHGGSLASCFLAQGLHANIASMLAENAETLKDTFYLCDDLAEDTKSSCNIEEKDQMLLARRDTFRDNLFDLRIVQLLKDAFLKTDAEFLRTDTPQHGSTATTALILGNRLYCANVGDSRTLLCRDFSPLLLSVDHKPSREDEAQRIREAGGFIINNRVMGELAISRAFGDSEFKKGIKSMVEDISKSNDGAHREDSSHFDAPLIIAEPDVQIITLTPADQFILLACDGLFDVFSSEDLVEFVKRNMEMHGDAQKCCQNLTFEAIRKRNSRDNVSVILVILNKWY